MTNLTDLYAHYAPSGTEPLGADVLTRELRRQTQRRRDVVKLILRGMTHREAGAELGITGGAVRVTLIETMAAIRKAALGLPRYHVVGRPLGRGYGKRVAQ